MKKVLTSIFVFGILVFGNTWAQDIPNAGFETWVQQGPFESPEGWDCGPTGTKSQPGHSGSFALVMQSGIFTNPMSGSVDTLAGGGNTGIGGPPGTPHVDGFAFASRPDSLISWFKYNAAGLDSFRLQVQLTKWIPGMGSRELIAFSEIKESSAADWKRLALNIQYFSNENPDTASIRFQSSVSDPQNPVLGSSLFVDDLSFVYNPLSVKNFSKSKFQFEVSPNPVSDFLKIQSEGTLRIQIIDSKGNLVLTAIKEAEALIDVSALPAGLYCIRLNDPAVGQFQMARFLKQ